MLRKRLRLSNPAFPWLWALLIVVIVVPWFGWQDHAHWGNVVWWPELAPRRALDAALNLLLYVPLGAAMGRGRAGWHVVVLGAALSLVTETTQLFSHSRVPSLPDLASNITGAWLGAWISRRSLTG